MARQYGGGAAFHAIFETTYGTAPGGNYRRLPVMSVDLGAEQAVTGRPVIGHLGLNRHTTTVDRGPRDVRGNVTVPVDYDNIGWWLRACFGLPTTTGSSPNFVHVFRAGGATVPSFTAEVAYPQIPLFRRHVGCVVDTFELDLSGEAGDATANIGIIGQTFTDHDTTQAGSPVEYALTKFNLGARIGNRNGSPYPNITGARIAFSNAVVAERTLNSGFAIAYADPTTYTVAGELTLRVADRVLLNEAASGTIQDLSLGLSVDANRSLIFEMSQVSLSLAKPPIEGPGAVQATFAFTATYDATDQTALLVTLRNGTSAYTAAA